MRTVALILLVALIGIGGYVGWYSYARQMKIAQVEQCNYNLVHPKPPTMITAPDGSLAPVYSIEPCTAVVVPPSLLDIIRGRFTFEGVAKGMKVNPYLLMDVLLGNYTLGPDTSMPCDQSATTTDCATLASLPQTPPPPYVPPNVVYPVEEWTSATNTPISFAGFSFVLPPGWHGSVYEKGFAGGQNALVQKDSNAPGFTIDCPPDGKGFEEATRLSTEERSLTSHEVAYTVSFEKWTAPGNAPWLFVWLRKGSPGGLSDIVCLAQGSVDPNVTTAMYALYATWNQ